MSILRQTIEGENEQVSGWVDLLAGSVVLTLTVAEAGENASLAKSLVSLTSSPQSPLELTSAA